MSKREAVPAQAVTAPVPGLWRWQGIAGGLRRYPARSATLILGCLVIIAAVGGLFFYPQVKAYRRWRQAHEATAQGDFLAAREHLRQCLAVWRSSGEMHFEMGRTCRRAGDFPGARQALEEARRLHWPERAIEFEYLLMEVQERGPQCPGEETLRLYALSNTHPEERLILEALVKGNMQSFFLREAEFWLNYWIEFYPQDWQPYFWRAQLRERRKLDEGACADYRQALELAPSNREAMLRLAEILQRRGVDLEESQALYERYLSTQPDAAPALLGLARCQRSLRQSQAARETLQKLVVNQHHDDRVYHLLALLECDEENYAKAFEYLRQSEALRPNEVDTAYQLSIVLGRLGKEDEAEVYSAKYKHLRQELEKLQEAFMAAMTDPRDIGKRFEVGRILLKVGEEDGVRWLQTVLRMDPGHQATHELLAEHYSKSPSPEAQKIAEEHRRRARAAGSSKSQL